MRFRDREHAGEALAELLAGRLDPGAVVYALPRGGVVLGAAIARRFGLPLDLVIPRKLGHPLQPEYAIGAVTETGDPVFNEAQRRHLDQNWLAQQVAAQRREAARRRALYSGGRARRSAQGRTAVVVDDGVATGLTLRAAVMEIRGEAPTRLIVAVGVAPPDAAAQFRDLADDFVAALLPLRFAGSVGAYYEDFRQLEDEDVMRVMAAQRSRGGPPE